MSAPRTFTFTAIEYAALIEHGDPAGWLGYYQQENVSADELNAAEMTAEEFARECRVSAQGDADTPNKLTIVVDSIAFHDVCDWLEAATEREDVSSVERRTILRVLAKLSAK